MRTVTHRAHHDRQRWREVVARALYRLSRRVSRWADRVDPWHEDDEWFTAPDSAIHVSWTTSWRYNESTGQFERVS